MDFIYSTLIVALCTLPLFMVYYFIPKYYGIDVEIEMTSEEVKVQSTNKTISLKPTIYVSFSNNKPRLVGVGADIDLKDSIQEINLFHLENLPKKISKKECFRSFFFHVFYKVSNRKYLTFAKVRFKGLQSLESVFNGKQEEVIWRALRQAGASSCSFITNESET